VNTLAPSLKSEQTIVVCLSGRGDKDMGTVMSLETA
jgi:tryptophan synthase beta subunit